MNFIPAITLDGDPTPQHWSLAFVDGKLLLPEAEDEALAPLALPGWQRHAEVRHYLGRLDGLDCWALKLQAVPEGWRPVPLRAAMMGFPESLAGLASRARRCWTGTARTASAASAARPPSTSRASAPAAARPAATPAYPRISPAMMALVWRPGEVLLARAPHFVNRMYSALAGFVEAGESIEQCIHREVAGRGGRAGRRPALLRQPELAVPEQPDDRLQRPLDRRRHRAAGRRDRGHAAWFPIDALPNIPPRFSISGHLIRDTVEAMRAA
jgi:NAD+ diphosphatase